ncbi:MlaA family lipoprotein [Frigidibacter sp. MR17.24]|uniref:MlaA family lipoprotein n=1 Tax=Frigidibacter sp. MR17.24 TaxID=3127345 RepID=UPI00301303B7
MLKSRSSRLPLAAVLGATLALSACADGTKRPDGVYDPIEPVNRATHAVNKGLDRVVLRPAAMGYGTVVPHPVRTGVSNFAGNLGMPSAILNAALQGRGEDTGANVMRFLVNTTFGIGGLIDVASDMGLEEREADFGQTLHTWGATEGAYVELPVFGPSTVRDATGKLVDAALDPFNSLQDPEQNYVIGSRVADNVNYRYEYRGTADDVLYSSADSYAQARLLYLQNRRFDLGQAAGKDQDAYDPYEDPYGN